MRRSPLALVVLTATCLLLHRQAAGAAPPRKPHRPARPAASKAGKAQPAPPRSASRPAPEAPSPGQTADATTDGSAAAKPLSPAEARRAMRPPPTPPELLLTFDDGPSLERTPRVLDELARRGLHAVFFVNGVHFQGESAAARKSRALLRRVVDAGHAVGNHTIHHYFLCGRVYSRRAEEEIEGNARLIEQAIGRRPELFRTPYGSKCPALTATLGRLGIQPIGWDIDPQDWRVLNTAKVRDYVIGQLRRWKSGRQILLMHDIHQCAVEALPQILDWIDEENRARQARGEPAIRIIDYAYLLPPRPLVPPILDGVGRVLVELVGPPSPRLLFSLLTGRPLRS